MFIVVAKRILVGIELNLVLSVFRQPTNFVNKPVNLKTNFIFNSPTVKL